MIPQKHTGGVQIDGLHGETSQFTIAANGKAFRTLIDGLYSNKIQAVTRELWSNAADSHIAAGCPDKPFSVSVPTSLDPTFRVRDFGTGLSHDGVMRLYTTIFESTKEDTNEQTGMLGLGSKSPFAYTDTFSVLAYDGQTKRIYVANIANNGVPQIKHIDTVASTEPRGLEVSFPVNRSDIQTFHREAQWVSMGFKVKPNVDGMDVKMPAPRLSGSNWAIYPAGSFPGVQSSSLIRQGVACYPNDQFRVPGLDGRWIAIVDVPIGTCDVTASREALSYTPATREQVQRIVRHVGEEVLADIKAEVAKAKTRIEIARAYQEFNGVLSNLRGSTKVSLLVNDDHTYPYAGDPRHTGDELLIGRHIASQSKRLVNRVAYAEEVNFLDRVRLFVDYGTPMVRKTRRIKEHLRGQWDYVVKADIDKNGKDQAVAWIVKHWELKPTQIFRLDAIPDPGPEPRTGAPRVAKKALPQNQVWMHRKNNCTASVYGEGTANSHSEGWSHNFHTAYSHLAPCALTNIDIHKDILYVTPLQAERLKLNDKFRFDLMVEAELKRQAAKLPVDDALTVLELGRNLSGHPFSVVREQFFSHISMTATDAKNVVEKAGYARMDLHNRQITASIRNQIRMLSATYPLLFGKSDKSVFETYVQQVQAAAKTAEEVKTA